MILVGHDNDGQATQSGSSSGASMTTEECVLGVTWPCYVADCAAEC